MINKVFDFINLHSGEEQKERVLDAVKSNISFRGSNLWILACAIVIASVGLNVNSTAVIIGAMLISPLMGPIVGAGFALAMYDFELLKRSGKNLLVATVASLVVATLYFIISPFKETQSELLARTSPNIYDVIIAFFGGLVGVVALTRVEKGNPIPGVAIATALMPPLCTAGYGLATSNIAYFFGAFYLYVINCFFICIATFLIVKYLRYEPVQMVNTKFQKRIRYGITLLIFIMIIPSSYLAYNLFREKTYSQNIERFISNEFTEKGYTVIYKQTKFNSNPKKIELAFLAKKFTAEELKALNQKLADYELTNTVLTIKQDTKDLKREILNELGIQNRDIAQRNMVIDSLQRELRTYKVADPEMLKEVSILFPEIKKVSMGTHLVNAESDSAKLITVFLYSVDNKSMVDTLKLKNWLNQKLKSNAIEIVKN